MKRASPTSNGQPGGRIAGLELLTGDERLHEATSALQTSSWVRTPRPVVETAIFKACARSHLTWAFHRGYSPDVEWMVEYTDQFEEWWEGLTEGEQINVDAKVRLLEQRGPALGRPHVDTIQGSRHPNMKELIVQHAGRPYRVLFAFDPRRCAILLIGGDKTGNDRWYEEHIPIADRLYDEHLETLRREQELRRREEG